MELIDRRAFEFQIHSDIVFLCLHWGEYSIKSCTLERGQAYSRFCIGKLPCVSWEHAWLLLLFGSSNLNKRMAFEPSKGGLGKLL